MALQRVRSLATTKFTDENVANLYVPAAGEMISIFVNGTYRGLRIGDGATVGGLSLVNSGSELYEYIGEAPPDDTELPVVDPVEDSDSGAISTPAPVVDETTGLVEQTLIDARLSGMNSLMFDGNSYLYKDDFAAGSDTWSFSGWFKRSDISDGYASLFSAKNSGSNSSNLALTGGGKLVQDKPGYNLSESFGTMRDTNWFHAVITHDGSKGQLYLNGELQEIITTGQTTNINTAVVHTLGIASNNLSGSPFLGRMANVQFIDGMALDANYFGEYLGANWVPKVYEGAYGANGFHLDFSEMQWDSVDENNNPTADSILQTVKDVSGNENHWSAA